MAIRLFHSRRLSLALGLACVVVGAILVTRPFTSLSVLTVLVGVALIVTGVSELADADLSSSPWIRRLLGIGWIVAGVLAIAWPDITVRGLALLVGISMIIGGGGNVIAGIRGTIDERLAALIGGLASVTFGLLALAWPDVTLLVVAVAFGARTVLFGLTQIVAALQSDDRISAAVPRRRGRLRRFGRVVGTTIALLLALVLASVSATLH
jgi:uncharacterized membrane protein HdeD (DUF308 family)